MAGSFGNLLVKAGLQATEGVPEPAPAAAVATPTPGIAYGPKVVVRTSRKGHGGKTVTLVTGVTSGHEALVSQWKSAFSVGVRHVDEAIVLQGDQGDRVATWLGTAGARVVKG